MTEQHDWKMALSALVFMILVSTLPLGIISVFLGYNYQHGWIGVIVISAGWVLWNGGPLLAVPATAIAISPWYFLGQWMGG
jgi:hypothetical protein